MVEIPTVKVATPRVPNYLMFEDNVIIGLKNAKISVADIPDDQLREIGRAWGEKLVERASEIRRSRERQDEREVG